VRSHAVDGLRGIAACAVVFYHSILHHDLSRIDRVLMQPIQTSVTMRDVLTKLALAAFDGNAVVYLFFVLSGAVLRISLERQSRREALPPVISFTVARLLRLYPPVVVRMLLFYALGKIVSALLLHFPHSPIRVGAAAFRVKRSERMQLAFGGVGFRISRVQQLVIQIHQVRRKAKEFQRPKYALTFRTSVTFQPSTAE
jgi:peptidoglycan/LPS O-acetylase OafA/YrhL